MQSEQDSAYLFVPARADEAAFYAQMQQNCTEMGVPYEWFADDYRYLVGGGEAYLLYYDGQAVGAAVMRTEGTKWRDSATLESIFITAAARDCGHGRHLVRCATSLAAHFGKTSADLICEDGRRGFYEACGFKDAGIRDGLLHMQKTL